jgi:hypothetical protein
VDILSVVGFSDVLRTGGALFLITRQSKWAKLFGWLWLSGEIYSLAQKERGIDPFTGKAMVASAVTGDSLLPMSKGKRKIPGPSASPSLEGFFGYAG